MFSPSDHSVRCRTLPLWLAAIVVIATGCSGKRTYPVEGTVFFKDGTVARDLAGYTIMFESAELKVGANAVIQADGTFVLGTFQDGDGAPPGTYRVAIWPPLKDSDAPVPPSLIHERYKDFNSSQIEVTVKPEKNTVEIKVERVRR